jgi:tetratricopeptide (TPR) repeat protein
VNGRATARGAAWPIGLLLLFVAIVRFVPSAVAPQLNPFGEADCDRLTASDLAGMERCVALRADDVDLLIAFGRRLEEAGDSRRAEDVYRRALLADPRDGGVQLRLGTLLLARGDRSGARAAAAAALATQPRNPDALDLARRAGASE